MQLNYKDIRKKFDGFYDIKLRDWMIYHQRTILPCGSAWRGLAVIKPPQDMWVYQALIYETKPEVIVEIGSLYGGCTQFLADTSQGATIVSVEIDRQHYMAKSPHIIDITGDCHTEEVASQVRDICKGKKTLIIHDGDHSKESVLKDLKLYSPMVSLGSFFIVEDGVVDLFEPKEAIGTEYPGALHAIIEFINNSSDFVVERALELYLITYCPYGFLRRINA